MANMAKQDRNLGRVFGGRYEIINVVGSGGSSMVYGVYDTKEDRTVAMKMLLPEYNDNAEAVRRFEHEADLLSLFSHDSIVKLYDKQLDSFPKYFIMEYVEGITLKKHILSKGALPQKEIFGFIKPVLSALGQVHSKGIVHSDIKPHNVVVLGDGTVRLMDFGISKALPKKIIDIEEEGDVETEGAIGTVHYVSPEQAEAKPLDGRSDIYSLGVMMYEMATGTLPFLGYEKANEIAAKHVNELPPAPSYANPRISDELEFMILKAMEKLPENRYQTAREMLEAIEKIENPIPETAEELTKKQKIIKYIKNFSIPSAIIGGLCALLVAVVLSLSILSAAILGERNLHKYVRVPELEGRVYSQLDLLGLDERVYDIAAEYVNNDEMGGKVLSQKPAGGKTVKLKKGEKCEIKLKVAYLPTPEKLPNVIAMHEDEAISLLEGYGYKVSTEKAEHEYVQKGRVFDVTQNGKEVTLLISDGYKE